MKLYYFISAIAVLLLGVSYLIWLNSLSDDSNHRSGNQQIQMEVRREEYKNNKHQYRLLYPVSAEMGDMEDVNNVDLQNADNVFFSRRGKESELFSISVVDPKQAQRYFPGTSSDIYGYDLKKFSEEFRKELLDNDMPGSNKTASQLKEIIIADVRGYQFTLTTTFDSNDVFAGPYSFAHVLLDYDGKKYILHYSNEDEESQKILASFKFE